MRLAPCRLVLSSAKTPSGAPPSFGGAGTETEASEASNSSSSAVNVGQNVLLHICNVLMSPREGERRELDPLGRRSVEEHCSSCNLTSFQRKQLGAVFLLKSLPLLVLFLSFFLCQSTNKWQVMLHLGSVSLL